MPYAQTTSVPVEKSRAEIEKIISKYGATHFAYSIEPGRSVIMFLCNQRKIRFVLTMPLITDRAFKLNGHGRPRSAEQTHAAWEQSCRSKWRSLLLSIKAKLETVASGIAQFEEEFLSYVIDPATNMTIYESVREPLQQRYLGLNASSPLLLTGPTDVAAQA